MADLYQDTLRKLLKQKILDVDMRVLVVCGGQSDREAFQACGFENVVISNLDSCAEGNAFEPYVWSSQDAEALTYDDGAFDLCVAHSGLHHCRSPHRGLLEMYRVASRAVVVFEPIDNRFTRLGVQLGLGEEYELGSVAGHDCQAGGIRNTSIPNYVYRWSRQEVEKTIRSAAPIGEHQFHYFYRTQLNWARANVTRNPLTRLVYGTAGPVLSLLGRISSAAANNFAFCIVKPSIPDDLFPWLTSASGCVEIDPQWMNARFDQQS